MNKVAIMTWFSYHNFGSSLQVTALSKVVNNLGYEANVINYIPHAKVISLQGSRYIIKSYIDKFNKKVKNLNKKDIYDELREQNFEIYLEKNIKLTERCQTKSELFELNDKFTSFICGSDQIWAPSCFNPRYFLDFVQDKNKKISYAPSIGLSKIEDKYIRNRMKTHIEDFGYLSIREEQGKNLIKELCNKEAKVVLDPTLLLSSNDWDKLANDKFDCKGKYILCYFLGDNEESWRHVKELSKKTGLSMKIIPVFTQDLNRDGEIVKGVGPAEFLSLIKNAAFVCTDSFHGTVFSITYEKPFYVYERFSNKDGNSQNSRIYNILNITNLKDRLILDKSNIQVESINCDFKEARERLKIKRIESIDYLKNSLIQSQKTGKTKYSITNTCCGCSACTTVCNKDAIEIKRNKNGFIKANINYEKCVECGLCKKVCPYNGATGSKINRNKHKLYMLKSNDRSVLLKSSSGGASYEISNYLCKDGYDVIGCVYNKNTHEAEHKLVKKGYLENLNIFQGSKYIQSNMGQLIKDQVLNCEKAVIFGTPCQIAAFDKLFKLKKIRDRFILIDLICHGVPTQNLWNKYIQKSIEKIDHKESIEVEFRDKTKGWRTKNIKISTKGKDYSYPEDKDLFYRFFEIGHCYGDFCYECRYREASSADIRIGDYWGPRYITDKEGVSMVIALTSRGEYLLNELNNTGRADVKEMNCSEYWTVQYPNNPIRPVFYEELINDLADGNILLDDIAKKYCKEFEMKKNINKVASPIRSVYKIVRKK